MKNYPIVLITGARQVGKTFMLKHEFPHIKHVSMANNAKDIGVSENTIRSWISLLEATNIIFTLQPFNHSILKRVIKAPKLYFGDTGLLCYLAGWLTKEAMSRGAQMGSIFETFVISEIVKSFENMGRTYKNRLFYYSGWDKIVTQEDGHSQQIESEIDLIIDYNHIIYPIEIKKASHASIGDGASFNVLKRIKDKQVALGTIICHISDLLYLKENLIALPIEYL